MKTLRITVYAGFDWRSRLTVKVVREAAVHISRTYAIPVEVEVLELPVGDMDDDAEVPVVLVGGREVSRGDVPSMVDIVDEAFKGIAEELGPLGLSIPVPGVATV